MAPVRRAPARAAPVMESVADLKVLAEKCNRTLPHTLEPSEELGDVVWPRVSRPTACGVQLC